MRLARVIAAVPLLLAACSRPQPPRARASRPSLSAPPVAAVVTPAPTPAWSEGFRMRSAVADFAPLPDVVVHAPPGFDARAPLHLVVVLHGMGHSPLTWLGGGLTDPRTGRRVIGWGAEVRHDLAGTRSLILAPQCDERRGRARLGRLQSRGGLRRFLDELLRETLTARLGGPHTLSDVESITLVGSSAGGPAIANLLDLDDLDGRVRNVVLFDSIYGAESIYARWMRGGDAAHPRRLVCIHGGSHYTSPSATRLAAMLRPALREQLAVQPDGAMTEAIRTHRAVFAMVNCEHICMGNAYLDKVLLGLELPRREPDPDPKTPAAAPPPAAIVVAPGSVTRGALTASDALMRDGSRFDDYAIDLAQGQAVTLDLRGGRTTGYLCHALDVQLRVLDGERVLADDDDSGGGLASRVTVRAPHAGRYTVRVMAHGPWGNRGEYTLRYPAG
ncbi:MAG: hypothetical protein EPO40_31365 [Myxococcaceae bacterium]|nr:MAG: hypothetical protein EPO40_31365 [Myxococcaceae bacterium]